MSWCGSCTSWTIWIHRQLPMLKDNVVFQNPCLIFMCGYVSHVCFKVSGKQLGMEGINFPEIWSECWELASVTSYEVFFTWAVGKESVLTQAMRISLVPALVCEEQPWVGNQNLNYRGRCSRVCWAFQDFAAICFLANIIQSAGYAVWSRTKIICNERSTNYLYFVAFVQKLKSLATFIFCKYLWNSFSKQILSCVYSSFCRQGIFAFLLHFC